MYDETRGSETTKKRMISLSVQKVKGISSSHDQDLLAVEEPLEIRLGYYSQGKRKNKTISITMRTPGDDLELAAGFLFTEGIIKSYDQVKNVRHRDLNNSNIQESNVVQLGLRQDIKADLNRLERHFYTTSSCGVCGKTSIEALQLIGCPALTKDRPIINSATIHRLHDALKEAQTVFSQTGGLHAAALFNSEGELVCLREDVGRHNAVDKLIGAQLVEKELPLHDRLLMVSGRASFELVQKALMAGLPILAAVGAPSSLAVDLALNNDMTLLGFVRENRFNIYSGEWRIK